VGKFSRILIVIVLVFGVLFLARNNVAWASSTGELKQSGLAEGQPLVSAAKPEPCAGGTVCPPPDKIKICSNGKYSVGGVSTLEITALKSGYCLEAFLRNHAFALGRIPSDAGKVLAHITFLQVYYNSKFVYDIPTADGTVEICYAVPPGTQHAKIYFFDFYGSRFGEQTGQPAWEPLQTTVTDGVACAKAQTSGAYALIGK
jgi:hypothetical protein